MTHLWTYMLWMVTLFRTAEPAISDPRVHRVIQNLFTMSVTVSLPRNLAT